MQQLRLYNQGIEAIIVYSMLLQYIYTTLSDTLVSGLTVHKYSISYACAQWSMGTEYCVNDIHFKIMIS